MAPGAITTTPKFAADDHVHAAYLGVAATAADAAKLGGQPPAAYAASGHTW